MSSQFPKNTLRGLKALTTNFTIITWILENRHASLEEYIQIYNCGRFAAFPNDVGQISSNTCRLRKTHLLVMQDMQPIIDLQDLWLT